MMILISLLIFIIILLSGVLLLHRMELKHLLSQLEQLHAGSQMDLTAQHRDTLFLLLYKRLNYIFSSFYMKEQKYTQSQNELKQTISNLAHDIRTPLTSAAGYLQMLEDCTVSEKQQRYEQIIEKRINELKDMLEELFLYTKLTNTEFTLECKSTAVFPILSDCIVSLYHVFEEKNMEPDIQFEEEDIHVLASPESLQRVFRNLLNNALTHGNGCIKIYQHGSLFRFSNAVEHADLIDTTQIFDRFYRADKTRPKGSSGLGLSIVKELVERMDGTIEADIQNKELVITITMPPH